jgi:acetoin utilization deacetylase AcuC-like enzyme
MGFCLFNNAAIAAEHARSSLGAERVLVVDWDLHHGNGTMHSFYDRDDILYFSTHQFPYYPGTGAFEQVGDGKGQGFTVNVPLIPGMGDGEYRAIFREVLAPVTRQFAPDLILVSTGFDTFHRDPLGGMQMTAEGYGILTTELMEMASDVAGGRLVMTLEGGYNLEGLSRGVGYSLQALTGDFTAPEYTGEAGKAEKFIAAVKEVQSAYWEF